MPPSNAPELKNGVSRGAATRRGVPLRVAVLGAVLVATGGVCVVALSQGWIHPRSVQQLVHGSGVGGMALYVVVVIALELLWIPRAWGLVAGGALFGPVLGGALSVVADMASAAIAYFLARGTARAWVAQVLAARPHADRVVRLLAHKRGGTIVAVLRFCPVAHYTMVHYAAGMAGVRPAPFLLGTLAGLGPGAVLYPVLGDSLLRPGSAVFWGSIVLLAVVFGLSFLLGRRVLGDLGS